MKFTKIITYFLFHLLIFTSSDICKMAAYCFLGYTFDTWLYIFYLQNQLVSST